MKSTKSKLDYLLIALLIAFLSPPTKALTNNITTKQSKEILYLMCTSAPNGKKLGSRTDHVCACAVQRTFSEFPKMTITDNYWKNRFGHHFEHCILGIKS